MYKASLVLTARPIGFLALCLLVGRLSSAPPSCPELDHADLAQRVDYLKQTRQNLKNECIESAIAKIEENAYTPAAGVLTSYLDFKVPLEQGTGQMMINHLPWMDEYPAARALYAIGKPATEDLVRAIADERRPASLERTRLRYC